MAVHATCNGGTRQSLKRLASNELHEHHDGNEHEDEEAEVSSDGDTEEEENLGLIAFTDLVRSSLTSSIVGLGLFIPRPVMQFCAIAH
jgi:hypothetical protein